MSPEAPADEVWRELAAFVHAHRDGWRRAVVHRTGLPFSRIRVLTRLRSQPRTVSELAHATAMDAPAATNAVNDLEDRGLVVRRVNPDNRRCKQVSLTADGAATLAALDAVEDPAPPALRALDEADLRTLRSILAKLST